jgi:two-component system, NarL family, nitrate/nitrite response regulator NarL
MNPITAEELAVLARHESYPGAEHGAPSSRPQPAGNHDKVTRSRQYGARRPHSEHVAAMKILLVAPPGIHSDALSEWLPDLTEGCEVLHITDPAVVIGDSSDHASAGLVLVDIDAGWSEAHAVVRTFVDAFPGVPVVALSSAEDDATINAAFDAGALGYVPTSYTRQVILGVLRIVLAGATHRPASSGKALPRHKPLFESRATDSSLEDYGLTPAEVEVLAKAATGKSNKAIGRELERAPGTVRAHMSSILRKLGAKNRGEAIVIAMRIDKVIRHEIQEAERGTLDRSMLLPHMAPQRLKEGATIFRKGDSGRELFLLQRGTLRLKEIKVTLQPGDLFGEIAIFSPDHRRTCTAVCETDAEILKMTADKVKEIYYLNPQFALFIVHLIAKRLIADASRAV